MLGSFVWRERVEGTRRKGLAPLEITLLIERLIPISTIHELTTLQRQLVTLDDRKRYFTHIQWMTPNYDSSFEST